jgi:SAM-dependent methyltransferase
MAIDLLESCSTMCSDGRRYAALCGQNPATIARWPSRLGGPTTVKPQLTPRAGRPLCPGSVTAVVHHELVSDPYVDSVYQWWHLSHPSPELLAAEADGWLGQPGRVLDAGCGLGTEIGYLAGRGWRVIGLDLSEPALRRANQEHAEPSFIRADVLHLPFQAHTFDVLLDRGCFHYLSGRERNSYAAEARRVIRPGGRMLLRACLTSAGMRNDVNEDVISDCFESWSIDSLKHAKLPSDTRILPALEVRLTCR